MYYLRFILSLFILTLLVSGCTENESQFSPTDEAENLPLALENRASFYMYHAAWDEWGRAARNCDGWGLCNFVDCGFCCIDDLTGEQVDCLTGNPPDENTAIVIIEEGSNFGTLTIKLDSNDPTQLVAISNQKALKIDQNLVGQYFTILSGSYAFDSSIGNNGGYAVDVSKP
jgi:hypothetical protein